MEGCWIGTKRWRLICHQSEIQLGLDHHWIGLPRADLICGSGQQDIAAVYRYTNPSCNWTEGALPAIASSAAGRTRVRRSGATCVLFCADATLHDRELCTCTKTTCSVDLDGVIIILPYNSGVAPRWSKYLLRNRIQFTCVWTPPTTPIRCICMKPLSADSQSDLSRVRHQVPVSRDAEKYRHNPFFLFKLNSSSPLAP
jgi:hypothetical protein